MKKNETILRAIVETVPFIYDQIEEIFDIVGSYDKTIIIAETAAEQNLSGREMIYFIKQANNLL